MGKKMTTIERTFDKKKIGPTKISLETNMKMDGKMKEEEKKHEKN